MTDLAQAIRDIPIPDTLDRAGWLPFTKGLRAAAELAAGHHAGVLRLRRAALWLAGNAPGTPVPEWVDAAVNDPALTASGDAAGLVGREVTYEVEAKGPIRWDRWGSDTDRTYADKLLTAWREAHPHRQFRLVEVARRVVAPPAPPAGE